MAQQKLRRMEAIGAGVTDIEEIEDEQVLDKTKPFKKIVCTTFCLSTFQLPSYSISFSLSQSNLPYLNCLLDTLSARQAFFSPSQRWTASTTRTSSVTSTSATNTTSITTHYDISFQEACGMAINKVVDV